MDKKIAYKGLNKDLTCLGFQYEVGKTYKHDGDVVKCAEGGFHSCESPIDIFNYYDPAYSVFYEVEVSGDIDSDEDDSKIASAEITLKAEIKLPDLITKAVDYIVSKCEPNNKKHETGYRSAASNTGDYSAASNTGYRSAAANTGYRSAASNTGDYSAASNTGDYSAASNTGDYSAASNTGYYSAASNTGDYSAASVEGKNSVALASGLESKAKACLGSAITVVYRNQKYELVHIRSGIAGKDIEPDTWYTLDRNGEFKKVEI